MKKYILNIIIISVFVPLFSQEYYTWISPVGWDSEKEIIAEAESNNMIIEEIATISDNTLRLVFDNEIYAINEYGGKIIITGNNNFILPIDCVLNNNEINIDLSKKLVLFISVSRNSNINSYRFLDGNKIRFPIERGGPEFKS